MPQEFQVLRCYKCCTFQVHQVKKSNKWNCKLCGEKQSVKKVFGRGSGYDCRQHVQKLNLLRADQENKGTEEGQPHFVPERPYNDNSEGIVEDNERHLTSVEFSTVKWNKYLEDEEEGNSDEDEMYTTDSSKYDSFKKQRSNKRKRCEHSNINEELEINNEIMEEFHSNKPQPKETYTYKYRNNEQNRNIEKYKNAQIFNLPKGKNKRIFPTDIQVRANYSQKEFGWGIEKASNSKSIAASTTIEEVNSSLENSLRGSKWGHFIEEAKENSSNESDSEEGGIFVTAHSAEFSRSYPSSQKDELFLSRSSSLVEGHSQSVSSQEYSSPKDTLKIKNIQEKPNYSYFDKKNKHCNQKCDRGNNSVLFQKDLNTISKNISLATEKENTLFKLGDLNDDDLDFDL